MIPPTMSPPMSPPLHRSTLVPATHTGDHHAPQAPEGLPTPDLLCINCSRHSYIRKILHLLFFSNFPSTNNAATYST